jgi:hypothetical protein
MKGPASRRRTPAASVVKLGKVPTVAGRCQSPIVGTFED